MTALVRSFEETSRATACEWADRDLLAHGSTAIVHDWCPNFRGGERVLAELCAMAGQPNVFTLFDFLSPDVKETFFPAVPFETSIANRLPAIRRYYRALFFFCPFLIEQFDVTSYDLVVSSSAAFARGVITRPDQPHVCYVHSPIRYAWDEQFSYLQQGRLGYGPIGLPYRWLLHQMRIWDTRTAHAPDVLLANSRYVRSRVRRVYGRDADVLHPPVPLDGLRVPSHKDDYYVTASFLAPYKRTDLVIKAFREMPHRRLLVVGEGQQSKALRAIAGPNVTFTGFLPRDEYVKTVGLARALVFAGCEDFGIALAEAQGCGTPIIAFGRGGTNDIVRPLGQVSAPTGVLFHEQTVAAVKEAIEHFEQNSAAIVPLACRENASRFAPELFRRGIQTAVGKAVERHRSELARSYD